jgi:hypothetical protein
VIVVVPLAGPDFEGNDGLVKSERLVQGLPLLRRALESRAWWGEAVEQLIFVLRDTPRSRQFARQHLTSWYPTADTVYLSAGTLGAAFSAAAGLSLIRDPDAPVIVDLCDILFDVDLDVPGAFAASAGLGGLAVTFESDRPKYSYLTFNEHGDMLAAREKVVISNVASAGVYIFRSSVVFLRALAGAVEQRETLAHNGALFVCPMLNGVKDQGLAVRAAAASNVVDVADARLV